jgi:F-type H+-transporting ATPase subunit gamma
MAEQMQDIKRRIKSIGSTERITNAMKLVSAAKLRHAKSVYEHSRRYLGRIIASIDEAFDDDAMVPEYLLKGGREIKTTCIIMLTSSTGLCGSFNGNVIRATEEAIAGIDHEVKLVNIGTKGKDYFARRGREILLAHDDPSDSITYESTKDIMIPLLKKYRDGEIDEILIAHTVYVNTLRQEVHVDRLLPIDPDQHDHSDQHLSYLEYEPSSQEVFDYLILKYLEMTLFSATIESATCEHAARRQAMENANDNASDMLNALQIKYNRARQSKITDEIIEIVSGSEAQS